MTRYPRARAALACILMGFSIAVPASQLVISREAVRTLVLETLFQGQGRWYFAKGICHAYLEHPHVDLAGGRIIIDGHLVSRLGLEVGDSCVGPDFASDVQLSGHLVGSGSRLTLSDIRIGNVKDESTRQALELVQSAAGSAFPRSVNVELLPLLQPITAPGSGIKVAVSGLAISSVTTQSDRVTVEFEMNLSAHQ